MLHAWTRTVATPEFHFNLNRFIPAPVRVKSRPSNSQIQAVASPASVSWTPSPVIVDRFPCDPKVARNGCDKPNENDPESRLDAPPLVLCGKASSNNQKTVQPRCALQDEARGIYGYPDLSLSASADGSANTGTSALTCQKECEIGEGNLSYSRRSRH